VAAQLKSNLLLQRLVLSMFYSLLASVRSFLTVLQHGNTTHSF